MRQRLGLALVTVARLALGFGMFPYAFSKLIDIQFQVGASFYARPLGEASGRILTWAFLGYSPVFQILLGVFELVPALLLFSARTRRLGALLMFPVLLNVTLINYFLDLWPGTQQISLVLLALNVFLLAYDWKFFAGVFRGLVVRVVPHPNRRLHLAMQVAGFVVPVIYMGWFLNSFRGDVAEFRLDDFVGIRQINRAGSWRVEAMRVADAPVSGVAGNSVYFDFTKRCLYVTDAGKRFQGQFQADSGDHGFQISGLPFDGAGTPIKGKYRVDGDRLLLDGDREGKKVSMVLRRLNWGRWRP